MTETSKDFFENFKMSLEKMKQKCPETLNGFSAMFKNIMAPGQLSVKQKELIAMGISVALQCEPCIKLHVKKCLDAEATNAEILEAASVAVMMQGGPAYTHIPLVIETLEELAT